MIDQTEITLCLPNQTIATLQQVSDLSGVPIETVATVILALFVINEQSK